MAKALVAKMSGSLPARSAALTRSFDFSLGTKAHKSIFLSTFSSAMLGMGDNGKCDLPPKGDSPTCHCRLSVPVLLIVNGTEVDAPWGTVASRTSGLTERAGARTLRVAAA